MVKTTSKHPVPKDFSEEESLFIALLYLEGELRRSNMPLTGIQLKKTIKTALEEISTNQCLETDTQAIRNCLERALRHEDSELLSLIERFDWLDEKNQRKTSIH